MQALDRVRSLKVASALTPSILAHVVRWRAILSLSRTGVGNLDLGTTIVRVVWILLLPFVLPPRIKQGFSFEHFRGSPRHLLVHIFLEAHLTASQIIIHNSGRQRLLLTLPVCSNRLSFAVHYLSSAQLQAGVWHLLYAVRRELMHGLVCTRVESCYMLTLWIVSMIRMLVRWCFRPTKLRFVVLRILLKRLCWLATAIISALILARTNVDEIKPLVEAVSFHRQLLLDLFNFSKLNF